MATKQKAFTKRPGTLLTIPYFPVADTRQWEGQHTAAVQDAFRVYGDRIEELTVFGTNADRPDPKGTATFYFEVDNGRLYFDGLQDDGLTAEWFWLGAEPEVMPQMLAFAGLDGETGFSNTNTDSELISDAATRSISLEPTDVSYVVWVKGVKYTITESMTIFLDDVDGRHCVVIDATGTMVDLGDASFLDIIRDNAYVCEVYVGDSEIKWVADERHGLMPWRVHYQQHIDGGTVHVSGLGLQNFSAGENGSQDSHAEFTGAEGVILDEDLQLTISTNIEFPVFYRSGAAGDWKVNNVFDVPIIHGAGDVAQWNEYTGATWQLSDVDNADFFLVHIFATTIRYADDNICNGYIAILGQAEYNTIGQARDGAVEELSGLITAGLPMAEFVPVGTVIYQYRNTYSNLYHCRVVSDDDGNDYVSWLNQSLTPSTPPIAHPNTSNRDAASQHPASSIDSDVSSFDNILSSSETTVQLALDVLDDHAHDDRYYTETEVDNLLTGYATSGHTHDDRYYTETEIDNLLAGYSVTSHTHTEVDVTDLDKYTQAEVDNLLSGKADSSHTHTESDITDLDKYTQAEVNSLLGAYLKKDGSVALTAPWSAGQAITSTGFIAASGDVEVSGPLGAFKDSVLGDMLKYNNLTGVEVGNSGAELFLISNAYVASPNPLLVGTVNEYSTGNGVTIDGVLLKDGETILDNSNYIKGLNSSSGVKKLLGINGSDEVILGDTDVSMQLKAYTDAGMYIYGDSFHRFEREMQTGGTLTANQASMVLAMTTDGSTTMGDGGGPDFLFECENAAGSAKYLGRIGGLWYNSAAGSETGYLQFRIRGTSGDNFAGTNGMHIIPGVHVILAADSAAPADADLWNESLSFYFDAGTNKIKVKHKSSGGTVRTGDVATVS